MIRTEQIPDEVVEAAYQRLYTMRPEDIRASIAAALAAWPGLVEYRGGWEPVVHNNRKPHLILPLPQEARDDA